MSVKRFNQLRKTGQYSDHEKEHISDKYPFADAYRIIKLEILVADEHLKSIIELIRESGRTGNRGDDLITIFPVVEVYKIRSDESGILML
jgi:nitrogen regulatory protein P-II 1